MADIRHVTDTFAVAPQISLSDLSELAALGFKRIVNNRPDGEQPGQPSSAEFATAAQALGLDYLHIPFQGGPGLRLGPATLRRKPWRFVGPAPARSRSGALPN